MQAAGLAKFGGNLVSNAIGVGDVFGDNDDGAIGTSDHLDDEAKEMINKLCCVIDTLLSHMAAMESWQVDTALQHKVVIYEVAVTTADALGAGTDANVCIQVHGQDSLTAPIQLDRRFENNFERGHTVCHQIARRRVFAANLRI